jgi:hypothetical protein
VPELFTGAVNGPGSAAPFVWIRGSLKMSDIRPRRSVGLSRTVDGLRNPPVSGPRDISRAHAIWRLVFKPSLYPSSIPMGTSRVVSSSNESMRRVSSRLCRWYISIRSTAGRLSLSNSRMQSSSTCLKSHFCAKSRIKDHWSGVALYTECLLQDVS